MWLLYLKYIFLLQIDTLKAEVIEVKGQNVSLMQDNETLEGRLQDAQDDLEKAHTQLEVQQHEMVFQTTEEKVEAAVRKMDGCHGYCYHCLTFIPSQTVKVSNCKSLKKNLTAPFMPNLF